MTSFVQIARLLPIKDPEIFRLNMHTKLHEHLFSDEIDGRKYAQLVERSAYNYAITESYSHNVIPAWNRPEYQTLYLDRLRSLFTNILKDQLFKKRITSNAITGKQLETITHFDMVPAQWEPEIQKILQRERCSKDDKRGTTDMYTCEKCQNKVCDHYMLQIRGADEPMTVFLECLTCGFKWTTE